MKIFIVILEKILVVSCFAKIFWNIYIISILFYFIEKCILLDGVFSF